MRILICNYEYPPLGGGGGVATAQLAQELAGRHQVTVLTSQGLGLPQEAVENGVRVVRVPVFFRKAQATASMLSMLAYIPMAIKEGKRLLRAEQYDVINTHFVLPTGPVGHALARFGGLPNVLTVHGGDLYDPSKFTSPHRHALLRAWVRRLTRHADTVVGQSKNTLDNVRNFYAPEIGGRQIPLGINRPVFSPVSRETCGYTQDDILLVTVGRLVARKAVEQLIAMMGNLGDNRVHLVVIGSGPQEQSLKAECTRQGLEDRVRFTGYISEAEKFQLLEMSDLYVSTSQHEGFGLVFLEAMHCGLPVVCYDQGGQTDFLQDGDTGYLVPLNDLTLFPARCRELINNADSRHAMGQHNQQLVEEYYIDNCARSYEEVFSEVLESGIREKHRSRVEVPSI